MLQNFQEKYRLTLENYLAYELEMKEYKTLFPQEEVKDFKKKLNSFLDGLKYPTVDAVRKKLDGLSGMEMGMYVSSFGYSIYGAHVNHAAIYSCMFNLVEAIEKIAEGLRAREDLTPCNVGSVYQALYKKHTESLTETSIQSSVGKAFFGKMDEFVSRYQDENVKHATYVGKLLNGIEKLFAAWCEVKALKNDGSELENLRTLRKLLDIYDLVVDVQAIYNDYEEEYQALFNYWAKQEKKAKQPKKVLSEEEIKKYAVKVSQEAVVKQQLADVKECGVLDAKTQKTLAKAYKAICAYVKKCQKKNTPVDWLKLQKLWKESAVVSYDDMSLAFSLTLKDFIDAVAQDDVQALVTLYNRKQLMITRKKEYDELLDSTRERIIEEEQEKIRLQATLQEGESIERKKLNFLEGAFHQFYTFTGAPLLDAMVELVYMDTFEDFPELPRVMQTKETVDAILKYFAFKRVDTVKEAINLYIQEHGEPTYEPPTCDKVEARVIIDGMYAHEEYKNCLREKQEHLQDVTESRL